MEATGTPRTAGHPGQPILYRVRLLILDTSSRTVDPGPSRDIVAGGTSWTIPMDPDGSLMLIMGHPSWAGHPWTVADGSWTVGDGG